MIEKILHIAVIVYLAIGVVTAGRRHSSVTPMSAIPWQRMVWWWVK